MSCAARYSETTSLEFILNPFKFFSRTTLRKSRRSRLPTFITWKARFDDLQSCASKVPSLAYFAASRLCFTISYPTVIPHLHSRAVRTRTSRTSTPGFACLSRIEALRPRSFVPSPPFPLTL
ncbi:hypothetical protein BUPH_02039 [Paraburkholderia phenoliruptrix BR3459a]|uniref:Uncharacterized protein n=1 Tax=Paraburkholderia phenoliruptrix BR3459a TaxID=1229205 RepID=K0DL82_9BURK|nr:hypothetical protein BUPH_02039 [Paraburkholderia phenoliruptrix BR3459a]